MNYDRTAPGQIARVAALIEQLRDLPFPPTYLDSVRAEMFTMLGAAIPQVQTYVYLGFFGRGDRATCLKIGVAGNVRSRMGGIGGSTPIPRLWLYTAAYPSKADALAVERALLTHMAKDRIHGEWVDLGGGISEEAARAVVLSLAEVAHAHHPGISFLESGL